MDIDEKTLTSFEQVKAYSKGARDVAYTTYLSSICQRYCENSLLKKCSYFLKIVHKWHRTDGKKAGTFGNIAILAGSTKNLGALGDGGYVTNNQHADLVN